MRNTPMQRCELAARAPSRFRAGSHGSSTQRPQTKYEGSRATRPGSTLARSRGGSSEQRARILRESPATTARSDQCHARILLRPVGDRVDWGHRECGTGLPDRLLSSAHAPAGPSLALDLAEELRPLTDRFVVSLVRRRQVAADSFVRTPGGAVYLSDDGRTDLIKAWETHKEVEFEHRIAGPPGRTLGTAIGSGNLALHDICAATCPAYPPFVIS